MQSSTRRGIQFPSLDRSDRPDVPAHIKNLVDALEQDMPISQGSFASRPANPGFPRWAYWSTDLKIMSYWDGSSWTDVGTADVIKQTLIDAKGDLVVGLSDNIAGRLGVGTNGYQLQADNTQPGGMVWKLSQVVDLIAAKGDILAGTGVDAIGRVAVGTDGTALLADSTQSAGVRFGAPVLSFFQNQLSADVTMTAANTFYDGPTISLPAGTWLLTAAITLTRAGSAGNWTAKLWDGSVVYSSVGENPGNSGDPTHMHLVATAVLASTTTVKASAAYTATGGVIKAATPSNSAGSNASTLVAVRIG